MAQLSPHTDDLDDAFRDSQYDALRPTDLVHDEIAQLRESGYDADPYVAEANRLGTGDGAALLALVDDMASAPRSEDWAYEEPDDLVAIKDALPSAPQLRVADGTVSERITAGWLGRIAGCNLGKPVEMGSHWTVERIRDYLTLADAYPLTDYVPVLDPMPEGFELRDNWPETTRGNVNGSARDDDIDYPILALHLLETHGMDLRPEHVGDAWTSLFPLQQVYTAERAAYINLVNGIGPPKSARVRNPYREWIGAQIRGDVFGYVNPGDPWSAAALSYQDATLSHVRNGTYGEMWAAGLVAAAFTADSPADALGVSLAVVPAKSRLAEALRHVIALNSQGITWEAALEEIRSTYGHYSWVHTINNAAVVAAALLWSENDFTTAVGRTVMSGWDTDSNGATVGSVMGVLFGREGLPAHFVDPLHDRTRSALFGFDNSVISDLAARTSTVITKLRG